MKHSRYPKNYANQGINGVMYIYIYLLMNGNLFKCLHNISIKSDKESLEISCNEFYK